METLEDTWIGHVDLMWNMKNTYKSVLNVQNVDMAKQQGAVVQY